MSENFQEICRKFPTVIGNLEKISLGLRPREIFSKFPRPRGISYTNNLKKNCTAEFIAKQIWTRGFFRGVLRGGGFFFRKGRSSQNLPPKIAKPLSYKSDLSKWTMGVTYKKTTAIKKKWRCLMSKQIPYYTPSSFFFDCDFFSWWAFTSKLLVPNKLPKTLLCFTNIREIKSS